MDAAQAHQEEALSLAEEVGDMDSQARTKIALWAIRRGGLVLVGRR